MSDHPPPPGSHEPSGPGVPPPTNPYGTPSQPSQPNPYGTPQPNPYGAPQAPPGGQPPYGYPPAPGGYNAYPTPTQTDGVSITAFVLSLTFCLSIVGVILGFVGLSRTKDGKRKGRWAAISAIVVGLVFTAIAAVVGVAIGFFAASVVGVDEAKAGMCVDVETNDDDAVVVTEAKCSESHDAEIVYAGKAGDDAESMSSSEGSTACAERVDESVLSLVDAGDYVVNWYAEDPTDLSADDSFVCYLERIDGKKLTEKVT